jgi:hypothetical protein
MAGFDTDAPALPSLARELHAAGVQLGELDPVHAEAGRVVLASTRPPRHSGYLGDHLTAGPAANGVTFASSARYWTWVHFGAPRVHVRAQPFYAEALHRSTDEVVAVYAEHARDTLTKIG